MLNKKTIFVINDFFGHGGHVKSFLTHITALSLNNQNTIIIASTNGFFFKNNHLISKDIPIFYFDMSKLRKFQFSFKLFKVIKSLLKDDCILNIYSYECYFSALLAKTYYKDVCIINSVMGGPNPFPMLASTDTYISVSKEQKNYVIKNSYPKNINVEKVLIIKNRIEEFSNNMINKSNDKYILIVSRFDEGMKNSLNNIVKIIKQININIPIKIAGTGSIINEYKEELQNFKNVEFLGFRKDLDLLRINACVVLGMGRSILESLLKGKPSVLVGHKGIEILEDKETVSFASDYNFSGRKIRVVLDKTQLINKIEDYYNSEYTLSNEVIEFLNTEYSINYFNEKYLKLLDTIESTKVSKFQILKEYLYIFFTRVKRKFQYEL